MNKQYGRVDEWDDFAKIVREHIASYAVDQYKDMNLDNKKEYGIKCESKNNLCIFDKNFIPRVDAIIKFNQFLCKKLFTRLDNCCII